MGKVRGAAQNHYSLMGYILDPYEQLTKSIPKMIELLKADGVDIAVLVPA
jgi:hypothetical protein